MSDELDVPPAGVAGPDPAYAVGFLLRRAHVRAARAFSEALRPAGIEGRHFAVLTQLADGPLSQRELVDRVGSDKASMVRVVDDLEAADLVRRQSAPHDRRIRAITLTADGIETLSAARHTARDVADGLLAHMPPAHRSRLVALLTEFLGA